MTIGNPMGQAPFLQLQHQEDTVRRLKLWLFSCMLIQGIFWKQLDQWNNADLTTHPNLHLFLVVRTHGV